MSRYPTLFPPYRRSWNRPAPGCAPLSQVPWLLIRTIRCYNAPPNGSSVAADRMELAMFATSNLNPHNTYTYISVHYTLMLLHDTPS
jgi:hypothetical protein